MLIGQQRRVDGNARAASRAVAPTGWCSQGSGLGSLVAVCRHIDSGQPLLLLCQLLELVLLFRVSSQLDECAEEVDARDQDNESHRAKECSQTGLPCHPTVRRLLPAAIVVYIDSCRDPADDEGHSTTD